MSSWLVDVIYIVLAALLVALNGFFFAAEFALVKTTVLRVDQLVTQGRPFAMTVRWLLTRLDGALSAAQLGITMASLGLGWVGEPAFAHLLEPPLRAIGLGSAAVVHSVAFIVSFTLITAMHLVIGEQAPKIFAIRRPEQVALFCAVPMKFFYYISYPLLVSLNASTSFLLRRAGVEGVSEHDEVHSEDEIRAMLRQAHLAGELTGSEHRLLNAVFEFDDLVCRLVMVPRADVVVLDINEPIERSMELVRSSKHSRYPLCDRSLDKLLGVVHIKDLVGVGPEAAADLRAMMRPPQRVPETMPISRLLRQFQSTRQHMAFAVDEYGTIVGVVTLENVLERIVGSVEDEFDAEPPDVVQDGPGQYLVAGSALIELVARQLKIDLASGEADTISGLLTSCLGRIPKEGDRVELESAIAHVLQVKDGRAIRIRLTLPAPQSGSNEVAGG